MAISALTAWTLFAFGGVYRWAALPAVAGCVLLAILRPPRLAGPDTRLLDFALIGLLAGAALQLVPLPAGLAAWLSPQALPTARELVLAVPGAPERSLRALSIRPASTAYWLALVTGYILLFWAARTVFAHTGLRFVLRSIAWMGLVVSLVALAQRATSEGVIYWSWEPLEESPTVFGPFVNRNHFATWLVMAIPLSAGYLVGRGRRLPSTGGLRQRMARAFEALDFTAVLLAAAICVMTVALVLSTSRSGLVSLAGAATVAGLAGLPRASRRGMAWVAFFLVLLVLSVTRYSDLDAVLQRFEGTRWQGAIERPAIWRDTLPVIRDFRLTGTGLGTYGAAMLVYQREERGVYFNQAHNHYLHMAAEGGLLLGAPAALAILALAGLAWSRVRGDRSGIYWIRLGASAGLLGVAFQSLFETGLRAPANAVLCAVVAAILLHQPRRHTETTHA